MEKQLINWGSVKIDDSPYISISDVLGTIQEPFDQMGIATKTFNNHYNDPESQYYHMTVDQIIEDWGKRGADSRHYGKMSDEYIETIITKTPDELELWKLDNDYDFDTRLHNNCDSFDNFYKLFKDKYEFIDREKTVYYKVPEMDYYIKGRFDALFRNKENGKYLVIDWKTSGTIDKVPTRWTSKLKGPAKKFPALNWYVYTMQVYFYKKALIANYLPEGTSVDDVQCAIVDLPGRILESTGKNWEYATPAFEYDPTFMDQLFTHAVKHKILEEKIAANKIDEIN